MEITIKRTASLVIAGSALGLLSLSATAGSCPTYAGVTWTATSAPTDNAVCHDYGSGNVGIGNYEVGPVTPPPDGDDPPTGDDLQIPATYDPIEEVQGDGSGPFLGQYLSFNETNGTFSISGLSASSFIILFKQATSWAAFVLPGNTTSGTYSFTGASGAPYNLSHAALWAENPQQVVPIPAAAWLLGSGLLGLFAVGRRRKGAQVAAA